MATLASVFCGFAILALVLININVNAAWMDDKACQNDLNLVGTYNNTDYYLSKDLADDFDRVQAVCKSFGGKLVEIDDEDENQVLKLFLKTVPIRPLTVLIGATDAASEGNWVYPSNNQPIPHVDWYHTEQPGGVYNGGTRENCANLNSGYDFQVGDYRCVVNSPSDKERYMCELPHL